MRGRHQLIILGRRGDTKVEWDLDAAEAVREAERIFAEHRARGYAAFATSAAGTADAVQIREFDPHAERIFLFPPMAGG